MDRRIAVSGVVQLRVKQRGGTLLRRKKHIYEKACYVALCIHDNKIPLLEWYEDEEQDSCNHAPTKVLDLLGCLSVDSVIGEDRCFVINFAEEDRAPIEILASSKAECVRWMSSIAATMRSINSNDRKVNNASTSTTLSPSHYQEEDSNGPMECASPERITRLPSTPIHIMGSLLDKQITPARTFTSANSTTDLEAPSGHAISSSLTLPHTSHLSSPLAQISGNATLRSWKHSTHISPQHSVDACIGSVEIPPEVPRTPPPLPPRSITACSPNARLSAEISSPPQASVPSPQRQSKEVPTGYEALISQRPVDHHEHYDVLPREMSALHGENNPESHGTHQTADIEWRMAAGQPKIYVPGANLSSPRRTTSPNASPYDCLFPASEGRIKEVLLSKSACLDHVAFVEVGGEIWIAGWDPKMDKSLLGVIHFGDQVVQVGDSPARSMNNFLKALHSQALPGTPVRLKLRPVPFGTLRVFDVPEVPSSKQLLDGKSIGLRLKRNKIIAVEARSIADRQSIPTHLPAFTHGEEKESPAVITEVNSVPMNLFSKSEQLFRQVQRLAAGTTCSIILHPGDFVGLLKHELKHLTNYKAFIHHVDHQEHQ